MIICKHCGQPISDKSKVCPFCGGNVKIPFYDKTWFHILLALIIFTGIDYVIRNPNPEPMVYRTPIVESAGASSQSSVDSGEETDKQETAEYSSESLFKMIDMVENYPIKAEEEYTGKYIQVSGYLDIVDSDGKYFTIVSDPDDFTLLDNIHWSMDKGSDVYNFIKDAKKGSYITVCGEITDVGETIYYMGDAHSVH
jgi:hypothetical protein